jgi:hypothetical protein
MREYTVLLPYIDEHEQDPGYVQQILALSNSINDDSRPIFQTKDPKDALMVVKKACLVCKKYPEISSERILLVVSQLVKMSFLYMYL